MGDDVPGLHEAEPQMLLGFFELAHDGNRRRWQNRAAVRFVVEADVAGDDRGVERGTSGGQAVDRARETPHGFRDLGVAEVEAVGEAQRLCADADDVARAFGDGHDGPLVRVQLDVATVAEVGKGQIRMRTVFEQAIDQRSSTGAWRNALSIWEPVCNEIFDRLIKPRWEIR